MEDQETKGKDLEDGYSANALLTFDVWMRDIDMWVKDWSLSNLEVIQFVKDHTMDHAHSEVEFYLDIYTQWKYSNLISHLKTSSAICKIFNLLVDNFIVSYQRKKEFASQFANALQLLAREAISLRPELRAEINEAL